MAKISREQAKGKALALVLSLGQGWVPRFWDAGSGWWSYEASRKFNGLEVTVGQAAFGSWYAMFMDLPGVPKTLAPTAPKAVELLRAELAAEITRRTRSIQELVNAFNEFN